jgi:hypothetical protein
MEQLKRLTTLLLQAQQPASSLRAELLELAAILDGLAGGQLARVDDIADGETWTASGLALSPTMAAMCTDDFVRTIEFLRGTHAALVDLREQSPGRPVRVLYVGCGPYGTLVVPLMTLFSPHEVVFTLLDVHAESIQSVSSIVSALGCDDSVETFKTCDARAHELDPEALPDVILMEIMQAALEKEPQVAIARHLVHQAPQAVLLPEEVRVDLTLIDPSHEFSCSGQPEGDAHTQRDRIPIGPVFVLNRQTAHSWDESEWCLPGAVLRIPPTADDRYETMLCTTVRIYRDHVLDDYSSGLTCPRLLSLGQPVGAGDEIRFRYELGPHPRIRAERFAATARVRPPRP